MDKISHLESNLKKYKQQAQLNSKNTPHDSAAKLYQLITQAALT